MEQITAGLSSLDRAKSDRGNVYRRIVLGMLSKMKHGHIRMVLPNGETLDLGDPSDSRKASMVVKCDRFFRRAVLFGDIGFGESFVDGEWETDNLPALLKLLLLNLEDLPVSGSRKRLWGVNLLKVFNRVAHRLHSNTLSGSRKNIADHYDLSNEFYGLWLDPSMTYSSAYFAKNEMSLEQAQTEKYDRLCRKLGLKKGDSVLEIGSGWGGFAVHAAKNYGVHVTTVTISREQFEYAVARIAREGLAGQVDVRLQDYRTLEGQYDKVISIEMIEAVGHEYLDTFFRICQNLVKPHGLLALQAITSPDSRYDAFRRGVDWIQKHIFPGSLLPSIGAMLESLNRTGEMQLHHLEDFGTHYGRTLSEWRGSFNARLDRVRALRFDDRFLRKWNYYLSYCEAGFDMRNISVVQLICTRPNNTSLP